MKVQRVRLPETNQVTWLVLDDDFVPVQPILAYLRFLHDLDRSPNTIRASAHHLKLFWEYLRDEHIKVAYPLLRVEKKGGEKEKKES